MKNYLFIAGIPPMVGLAGAGITEYVLKIGVQGASNIYSLLAGAALLMFFVYFETKRMSYAFPAFLGFMLIPYFAFAIGQIDFYMVDDNLAEGITVAEVRPTMNRIVFGTPDKGDVDVWKGPNTLKLHPGENRVKLGRFDMPAGTYKGGRVEIGDIQVDIQADLAVMKDPVMGGDISEDKYAEVFDQIKSRMTGNVGGFNIKILSASLDGNLGKFTISVGTMIQQIPIPEIKYPGMGGPDITLDITLDEMGKPDPSKIKAIIDMPPGVGQAFPSMPGVEFN